MKIIQATIENIDSLLPLFEGYREFYKQSSNPKEAYEFLSKRFRKNDTVIFMTFNQDNKASGFTLLYPTFSTVSMQGSYLLNDLYVVSEMRGKGIGEALSNHAKKFIKKPITKD